MDNNETSKNKKSEIKNPIDVSFKRRICHSKPDNEKQPLFQHLIWTSLLLDINWDNISIIRCCWSLKSEAYRSTEKVLGLQKRGAVLQIFKPYFSRSFSVSL